MDTQTIIDLMTRLNAENEDANGELVYNEEKLDSVVEELNLKYEEIIHCVFSEFKFINKVTKLTPEWKFLILNFYCLHLLKRHTNKETLISVANTKLLRKYVKNMVDIGILQNILPKLPSYKVLRKEKITVKETYYMLRNNVLGLHYYTFSSSLGYYLTDTTISGLLVGIIQLGFCPIIKPSDNQKGSFIMTIEFYNEVTADQKRFQKIFLSMQAKLSTRRYFLNLAMLMSPNNPRWFMDVIKLHLNYCLKKSTGIKTLFSLMDSAQQNQPSNKPETMGRLVSKLSRLDDFDSAVLPQVEDLLYENNVDEEYVFLFGEILIHTYKENNEKGMMILQQLFGPLKKLMKNTISSKIDSQKLSNGLISVIKIIPYVFINSKGKLPICLIGDYVGILFNIYMFLEPPCPLINNLRSTLVKFFLGLDKSCSSNFYEYFIFNIEYPEILVASNKLDISFDSNNLIVSFDEKNIKYDILKSARSVVSLFNSEQSLHLRTFLFLLDCLLKPDTYFSDGSLLVCEDDGYLSVFEKKIAIFEMLQTLSSQQIVDNYFKTGIPKELLQYFNQIFEKALRTGAHNNSDHEDHQSIFTTALILESIFKGHVYNNEYGLITTIKHLHDETDNTELKTILGRILESPSVKEEILNEDDEVEENIRYTLSECIATQGHGLIALKQMIISMNPNAVKRKQFIFTIFKNKLSDRDSYIYLAAINGLASIADLGTECTTMVLKTLCEEYGEFPTEEFGSDSTEMRLKIGEVLVKISRNLGEMAPHHKSRLLNTFLNATKDEDHLVRASALSNMGEICRVLGYKVGSIVTEILNCAHSIFSTDKHDEPRRAAVLVIQQLLAGLGKDMLSTIPYDIMSLYQTLKYLYNHDNDDILKLHCELALRELNRNTLEFLTPQYEINKTEKVVILK